MSQTVTHTFTSTEGAVVVITGVPAIVVPSVDGPDEVLYSLTTAEQLEAKIQNSLLKNPTPGEVQTYAWHEAVRRPYADLELHVEGESMRYGEASLAVWARLLDRLNSAYQMVVKAMPSEIPLKDIPVPQVAYTGNACLLIGVRARTQQLLFAEAEAPQEVALKALRQILQTADWIEEGAFETLEIEPALLDASLRALEELSPSPRDEIDSITIVPNSESLPHSHKVVLTRELRKRAESKRIALAMRDEDTRLIELVGEIDKVDIDYRFHVREISEASEAWANRRTADVLYTDPMLPEILEAFRNRRPIRIVAKQRRRSGNWDRTLSALSFEAVDTE